MQSRSLRKVGSSSLGELDLAILGAGPHQMPLILAAHAAGLKIMTIDGSPDRIGHAFSRPGPVLIDLKDEDTVAESCFYYGVKAIASIGSDIGARTADYCMTQIRAAGFMPRNSMNKLQQLKFLERHGLPTPCYRFIHDTIDDAVMASVHNWRSSRIVFKPINKWGSFGVSVVHNSKRSIDQRRIHEAVEIARRSDVTTSGILVQEYLEGDELGVAATVKHGRLVEVGITRKIKMAGDWRSYGHFPIACWRQGRYSGASFDGLDELADIMHTLVDASRPVDSFSLDIDVIMSNGHPRILEFAYRLGGNCIGLVCDEFFGTELVSAVLDRCVGPSHRNQSSRRLPASSSSRHGTPRRPVAVASRQSVLVRALAADDLRRLCSYLFLGSLSLSQQNQVLSLVNSTLAVFEIPMEMSYSHFCNEILPSLVSSPSDEPRTDSLSKSLRGSRHVSAW